MIRLPVRAAVLKRVGHILPEGLLLAALALLVVIGTLFAVQWARAAGVPAFSLEAPAIPTTRDPRTCSSFPSQAAAQAAYRSDPQRLAHLDGDGDGLACEALR